MKTINKKILFRLICVFYFLLLIPSIFVMVLGILGEGNNSGSFSLDLLMLYDSIIIVISLAVTSVGGMIYSFLPNFDHQNMILKLMIIIPLIFIIIFWTWFLL